MHFLIRMIVKVLIALGAVIAAGFVCIVGPASKTFTIRQELHDKTDRIVQSSALLQEFKDPSGELSVWKGRLKNLDQRFPTEQAITFVMQQLGDKSKELGLEILAQNPVAEETPAAGTTVTAAPFEKKKVLLELRCGYEGLGRYLAAIATLPTFFSVEELDVTSKLEELPNLNVRLMLAFYVTKAST